MLEAASAGAKVLHNRSVHLGKKNNMRIYVKNSQNNKKGTVIEKEENDSRLLLQRL